MTLTVLGEDNRFPPADRADPEGLLAVGGDLSQERLLQAYKLGIFPWYETQYILWWCPDPRFCLFPGELRVSKSMRQLLKKGFFEFRINSDFQGVISHCKSTPRLGQAGTWITQEMKVAYEGLHHAGYAESAEVFRNGQLVGGLYGVRIGRVFFGESMFSLESNASKFAFIRYVDHLKEAGVELIDCQIYSPHLESLGARMIPRVDFLERLASLV